MSATLVALLVLLAIVLVPVRLLGRWLQTKGSELEKGRPDDPSDGPPR